MADEKEPIEDANGVEHEPPKREPTVAELEHVHHMTVLNEAAKRVHTVLANFSTYLARGRPEQACSASETHALINGCASGLACFCAMMDIQPVNPDAPGNPPEDVLATLIEDQFKHVFRDQRAKVEAAIAQVGAMTESGVGSGGPKPN